MDLQPRLCTCHCAAQAEDRALPSERSAVVRTRRPPRAAQPRGAAPHACSRRKRRRRWRRPQSWVSSACSRGGGGLARGGARALAPGEGSPGRALIRSRQRGEPGGGAGRARRAPPPPRPLRSVPSLRGENCHLSVASSQGCHSALRLRLIRSFLNVFLTLSSLGERGRGALAPASLNNLSHYPLAFKNNGVTRGVESGAGSEWESEGLKRREYQGLSPGPNSGKGPRVRRRGGIPASRHRQPSGSEPYLLPSLAHKQQALRRSPWAPIFLLLLVLVCVWGWFMSGPGASGLVSALQPDKALELQKNWARWLKREFFCFGFLLLVKPAGNWCSSFN